MSILEHARYICGEVLGEGAQGVVVRVIDRERPTLSLVAKVQGAGAAASAAHLEGEFALLARVRVPGLVRVHDFARDARGVAFLVEDLVVGSDPAAWLDPHDDSRTASSHERSRRLVTLAADLAETLAGLHDAGFVHGDVKPANVRVPPDGRAVLLDLGAAAALRASSRAIVYTEAFAAPELRAGAAPSVATDLHALGATLWACATGAAPVARTSLRDRAPWLTPSVAAVVESLVAEHPADRPRTALEVIAALGRSAPRASWEAGARGSHAREADVARLLAMALAPGSSGRRVVYVTGPSGVGKSHLVREVATRALLAGRDARSIRFPAADAGLVSRLVAYSGRRARRPVGAPRCAAPRRARRSPRRAHRGGRGPRLLPM